jgi:hypothetical protein
MKIKEKELHPTVVNFLKDENGMKCFDSRMNIGHGHIGFSDAYGIKDIGGKFNSNVIGISVEVKTSNSKFGKIIGQALGYSLFAHRCYLAIPQPFNEEHIEMANRLGVGLIEIKGDSCKVIQTAQPKIPIKDLFLHAVYRLGWCQCAFCREFFQHNKRWTRKSIDFAKKDKRIYRSKIIKNNVYFNNENKRYSVILCSNCLKKYF